MTTPSPYRALPGYSPAMHRFAVFTVFSTILLVLAGGLVTSTGSALAVPDWPLAFGEVFPPMVDGVLFEHGHRMVATGVGALVTVLMVWLWRREPRRWVRWLGTVAFFAVVVQGLLGGVTVLMRLPLAVSLAHACIAQAFLCLCVSLAVVTSRAWLRADRVAGGAVGWPELPTLASALTGFIFVQLFLGALVRHTGSGVAIPDFPLAFGRLIPPTLDGQVLIAFFHRLGAVVVGFYVIWFGVRVFFAHRDQRMLLWSAWALLGLFVLQVALGGWTVLSVLAVVPATAHVVTGAMLLATGLSAALWSFRMARHASVTQRPVLSEEAQSRASASWAAR